MEDQSKESQRGKGKRNGTTETRLRNNGTGRNNKHFPRRIEVDQAGKGEGRTIRRRAQTMIIGTGRAKESNGGRIRRILKKDITLCIMGNKQIADGIKEDTGRSDKKMKHRRPDRNQ